MATFTITPGGGSAVTITPLPGTLVSGGGHDDRGGDNKPIVRAGEGSEGECLTLIDDSTFTVANAIALRSGVGVGDRTITDVDAGVVACNRCLVDIQITGDAVQVARIQWKGTTISP